MTIIDDRYEIGDPVNGVDHHRTKRAEAFKVAKSLEGNGYSDVRVFDRMAGRSKPHEWSAAGVILCWQDRRCKHELGAGLS